MARVVGDIAVEVGADVSPLQRALNRGGRDLDTFGGRAAAMGVRVAKVGGIVAAGLGVAAGAAYGVAKSAADAGAEIERMARLAGTTPRTFQRMAEASRNYGIEQDKLADILKDVQDRVGDFLATGGGPMKDFFENIAPKVGVMAEDFKNLGGPAALQLYVRSLEKANVSQDEMTFYLEAMASDLTQMLPLLTNSGAEMERLGNEAEKAGRIMSDEAVQGSQELRRELEDLTGGIRNQLNEAILENKDQIIALANDIQTIWIPALVSVAQTITTVITAIGDATRAYQQWRDLIRDGEAPGFDGSGVLGGGLGDGGSGGRSPLDPLSGGGGGELSPEGAGRLYGIGGDNTQGNSAGDTLGFMAEQNALVEEQQLEHFARLGEILADYQSSRFAMLSEAGEQELEKQAEFAKRSREIEEMSGREKVAAVSGAFGDLASLMSSENEKLFKIGKAAAIAEATVSGYQAAVSAWEKGMEVGGPPTASLFTAASLARTGALISQIASQSIGGSSGGGGGGGGASAASAPAQPTQTTYVNLQGDTFSRSTVEGLLSQIQSDLDRGGRLVFER